jgi:predicted secreted protein
MATLTGNDGQVLFAGNVVAAVRNFTIDMTADTIETTIMGTDSRTYVKGLSSYSGSADIYFDPAEFNGNAHFNISSSSASVGASPISSKFYVNQSASDDTVLYTNSVIITGYSISSAMDGMVEASISFQGSGPVAFNTGGAL